MNTSNSVVHLKYENFIGSLPIHLQAPSLADTLLKACCSELCCYQFSADCIMKCRLLLPVNNDSKDSIFNVLLKTHFLLMKLCMNHHSVEPKICNVNVCAEFFRRVYCIPQWRYLKLQNQLILNFENPLPHGNTGRVRESTAVLLRIGCLVNSVATLAEPRPDGKGFQFPSSMTKKDVIDNCFPSYPKMLNPTVEFKRLSGSFHFHKNNDKTKCSTCVKFKTGLNSKLFKPEFVAEAKMHLKNHYENERLDKRDYYSRMACSRNSNSLLSMAHDGFSKEATKVPHLMDERLKTLTDATKIMCSLNLVVVHKKFKGNSVASPSVQEESSSMETGFADSHSHGAQSTSLENNSVVPTPEQCDGNFSNNGDAKDQLHAFWNIGQINGSESNVLISQLYLTISKCDKIPSEISIQLDNCPSNKSYTVLGAMALLILWIPQIKKVYLCYPEVGHTHDDVDRYFGCLARPLRRTPVYSPFDFQRFLNKHLHGVVSNALTSPVYDFDAVLGSNVVKNGKLKNNHFFEISTDANGDSVVRIAHFVRSELFLQKSPNSGCIFKIFKNPPNLTVLPPIVAAREFNMEQFNRLINAVHHAIPQQHYDDLLRLPGFLQDQIEAPFNNVLQLCRSKVVHQEEEFHDIPDPDNIHLNAFLNNPDVWKSWHNANQTNEQPSSSENDVPAPPAEEILEPEVPLVAEPIASVSNFVVDATEEILNQEVTQEVQTSLSNPAPETAENETQRNRLSTLRKRKTQGNGNSITKKR